MSRTNPRSPALRRRPSRTVPATVVAVVLLAAGVLVAISGVARLLDGTWPGQLTAVVGPVAAVTWGSAVAVAIGIGAAVIGLVLVLAAAIPGGYGAATLQASGPGAAQQTEFAISNRGLARLATATADAVDGVHRVSASATGRSVRVSVRTPSREEAGLIRDRVRAAVTERLVAAGVQPSPQVTVTVRTEEI